MSKEESNVYLKEINDRQRAIDKLNELQNDYNNVVSKHNELADRIDKVIKYIEEHKVYNKGFEKYDICDLDIKNILEILKGGNNEIRRIK